MTSESKAGTGRSISAFFERDHREIDAIFASVSFESPGEALAKFKEFDGRLERHINWEEDILFPAVGRKEPGLEAGPLRVMKMEHREIRENKAAALQALGKSDGKQARGFAERMCAVLRDHNGKEEMILYPACDNLLTQDEVQAVLSQVSGAAAV